MRKYRVPGHIREIKSDEIKRNWKSHKNTKMKLYKMSKFGLITTKWSKKSITPPFEILEFWVINHSVENNVITYDVIVTL